MMQKEEREIFAEQLDDQGVLEAVQKYCESQKATEKSKAKTEASTAIKKVMTDIMTRWLDYHSFSEITEDAVQTLEKRIADYVRKETLKAVHVEPYTETIKRTIETIQSHGIEISPDNAIDIVKAVTEYQCKVMEKESYSDWAKIQKNS